MKNNRIGEILKDYRNRNKLTVTQVSEILEERYHKTIAEKTIYGWESNQAHPTTDTFLNLCEIYKINNIANVFLERTIEDFAITIEERRLIESYRNQPQMHDAIKRLLDLEP